MPNHLLPDLPYDRAMRMALVIPVRECHADVFMVLMQHIAQTARDPEKALSAMKDLDFSRKVDRWHALNSLTEMGAALPLGV
jgi:hypothetical protein